MSSCRWPLWGTEKPTGVYCGAPAVSGRSYCEHHRRVAAYGTAQAETIAAAEKAAAERKTKSGSAKARGWAARADYQPLDIRYANNDQERRFVALSLTGLTREQIGEKCGVNKNVVAGALYRVRQRMQAEGD